MTLPSNLRGIVAMVLSMGLFIASDSCVKHVLLDVPFFEMVLLRGIAGVAACLAVLVAMGHFHNLTMMLNPWALARGFCEVVANFAFTVAIMNMPLADVTAIAQTCPLLVLIGARLFWREELGPSRLALIAIGLSGALLVAQPGSTAASPFALLGFIVAISAAMRDLITRKVPADIPAPIVAFTVLVILMLAGEIGMLAHETPVMPSLQNLGLLVLSGLCMVAGHIGVFLAYRIGPARSVAPFMYSVTVWAVLAGFLFFGDVPNTLAIVGMCLVLTAGLAVIWLDRRRA